MTFRAWNIFAVIIYALHILAVDPTVTERLEYVAEVGQGNLIFGHKRHEIKLKVNESAEFTCSEENDAEWKVQNTIGGDFKSMSRSQILVIQNLTLSDEGLYACFSKGKVVAEYNLTVIQHPYFMKKALMQPLLVKPAGNMAQLKCKAAGNPTPNISWLKDDQEPKRRYGEYKMNHWSLTLEDLDTEDKGNYTCIVCNEAGCIDFTYQVDVVEGFHNKPIITNPLENLTATVGSHVYFKCEFLSDWFTHITWYKIFGNSTSITKMGNRITPEVLEIHNVTYEDEGWYACVGAISLGQTTSKAYLSVVDWIPDDKEPNCITMKVGLIIAAVAACVFLLLFCICLYYRQKIKREKREKIIAVETARAAIITQ